MKVSRVSISKFRGIRSATILLPSHGVLIGDNNTGKTTLLEAIDLVLGPDRLSRTPPVDEHDFYRGEYVAPAPPEVPGAVGAGSRTAVGSNAAVPGATQAVAPLIEVEVAITDLNEEQKSTFVDYIEFWESGADKFYDKPDLAGVDAAAIREALRVTFRGWYDAEEDDFEGRTYFTRSLTESDNPAYFTKKHKQICGFLYLRSLRTGSRALSLERGSLLDLILRVKEVRPQMWEDTITTLAKYSVASDPELGISGVLESINTALKKYVPKEWGIQPHLKVSNLTREHLRKVITAFIATGDGTHAAPFYRQGTGTINMLVLAMLSQIAEDKQNVIFAMEEPETAIPPYAQKRIVHEVRKLASQTLFTSHSPYVLEEFGLDETLVLDRDMQGDLCRREVSLPASIKLKRYRQEFRTRFCEGLLARRVLIAEGATEASAFPAGCRRLAELKPDTYSSLEALGICTIDAGSHSSIADLAKLYRDPGKETFALCDKQESSAQAVIAAQVDCLLMHQEKDFEVLVLKGTSSDAMRRFARLVDWPPHLKARYPDPEASVERAMAEYFEWSKGNWGVAAYFSQCDELEVPQWVREACLTLMKACLGSSPVGGRSGTAVVPPVEPV